MFPIILIHRELPHLQWICTYNENEELESALINKHTREIVKRLLGSEDEAVKLLDDFSSRGWTKGYLPDVNIINDGKIIQTLKLT